MKPPRSGNRSAVSKTPEPVLGPINARSLMDFPFDRRVPFRPSPVFLCSFHLQGAHSLAAAHQTAKPGAFKRRASPEITRFRNNFCKYLGADGEKPEKALPSSGARPGRRVLAAEAAELSAAPHRRRTGIMPGTAPSSPGLRRRALSCSKQRGTLLSSPAGAFYSRGHPLSGVRLPLLNSSCAANSFSVLIQRYSSLSACERI